MKSKSLTLEMALNVGGFGAHARMYHFSSFSHNYFILKRILFYIQMLLLGPSLESTASLFRMLCFRGELGVTAQKSISKIKEM